MPRKKNLLFFSLFLVQFPIIVLCFYFLIQEFRVTCVNKDFLSWDADLRFIKTIQLMDFARNFNLFSFLFQLLDTPTWPILRNLIQMTVFTFTGLSSFADQMITVGTSGILLGLVFHIFFYLTNKNWISGLLFIPAWIILLLSPPLLMYTFSGMLEVQGALFFLASIYYLFLFYREEQSYRQTFLIIKLSLSVFALFNTKYPYGYLLVLTILIVHSTLYLEETILFFTRYIAYFTHEVRKQYRIILIFLMVIAYLFLPEFLLKGKSKTYLKYGIVLLASIDFYIYLFKQTQELINLKFQKLITLFKWVFLPVVLFVLIHPDRFSSSSSTLAHVQTEGHLVGEVVEKNLDYYLVFFKSITNHSFFPEWIGYVLLLGLLVSVFYGYFIYFREKKIESYFFFSVYSLFTILILTFFTPNHQARHVYHLLPAILVGVLLLLASIQIKQEKLFYGLILIFSLLIIIPFYNKFSNRFKGENVCYTGKNQDDFFTPRELEKLLKKTNQNTIFFNFLNPIHVNKADTELVLSKIAYENKIKILINPKNFKENPYEQGFQEAYILSDSCEKEYLMETWFKKFHPSIKLIKQDDPKLSITYQVESKGKSFILGPPYPGKNLFDRKIYRDPKFSTGEGCLQTVRFSVLP